MPKAIKKIPGSAAAKALPTQKRPKRATVYWHNGVDKIKRVDLSRSQSEKFVGERSPKMQYFIDVLALAFILSLALLMLGRVR